MSDVLKIQGGIDYYRLFKPVDLSEERAKYFRYVSRGSIYNPQFTYPKSKHSHFGAVYKEIMELMGQDDIADVFLEIYLDVLEMVLAQKGGRVEKLIEISGKLFGTVAPSSLPEMLKVLKEVDGLCLVHKRTYGAGYVSRRIDRALKIAGQIGWELVLDESSPSEVSIYSLDKRIILNPRKRFSAPEIKRIITHEIYAHLTQTLNAGSSKYKDFLQSYIGTELQYEGVAVFTEISTLPLEYAAETLRRYLLLMIAIAIGADEGFYRTERKLYELCGDGEFSFMATFRAKVGLRDTSISGSFQKENSYLVGAERVARLVTKDKLNYSKLLTGKFPLNILDEIDSDAVGDNFTLNKGNVNFFLSKMALILDESKQD